MFSQGGFIKIVLIVFCIALYGCAKDTTVTDDVFSGIHSEIQELTEQLPVECKTDVVNGRINALTAKVNLAQKSCNKDIDDCRADARRWRYRFWGLVFGIGVLVAMILYGRVRKIL